MVFTILSCNTRQFLEMKVPERHTPLIHVLLHNGTRHTIYLDEIQSIKQLLMGSRITILVEGEIHHSNTSYSKDLIDLLRQTAQENWDKGIKSVVLALEPLEEDGVEQHVMV
jgi:hypothetical protein